MRCVLIWSIGAMDLGGIMHRLSSLAVVALLSLALTCLPGHAIVGPSFSPDSTLSRHVVLIVGSHGIHGELLKLGIDVGQTTVARYMAKRRRPPSQGWKVFLHNYADAIASMDMFVVPTISFRLSISHSRRASCHSHAAKVSFRCQRAYWAYHAGTCFYELSERRHDGLCHTWSN